MNKKAYQKPAMQTVNVNMGYQLLAGSLHDVRGNAELNYGGGGSSVARSRGGDDWDEE